MFMNLVFIKMETAEQNKNYEFRKKKWNNDRVYVLNYFISGHFQMRKYNF